MAPYKWILVVVAFALGCGDGKDKQADPNSQNVVENNAEADMGGGGEVGVNNTNNSNNTSNGTNNTNSDIDYGGCQDALAVEETVDVDPGEFAGQFYARTAWDGEGAWVVYNRPDSNDADSPEEIFAARVSCGGLIEHGPIRLSTANGERNYMPVIASRGGITHVAWVEEGNNPERIWLQMLNTDGEVLLPEPADITPSVGGTPVSTLVWEPDIAVWDDGTGAIVASAGTFGELQIVLQRYDATGAPDGDATTPYPEAGVDQKRPTIAAAEDGTLFVGWTRYKAEDATAGTPEEPERTVFTSIPAGASEIFPAAPAPGKPLTNPNPIARYSREAGPGGAHYLAFQVTQSSSQTILVRDGTNFETAETGTFGTAGWANFRPSVAAGKAGGVLAWYRYNESPLRNVVMVHPFGFDGTTFTPGVERVIETTLPGVPPYGPDVTWASGSLYFVVWGEGATAPEARVKGRWILL